METQRQPKDSNWYNNRLVLILMFLALYVIIPVLLVIFKDKIYGDNITFSTFIFVLVVIAPICYLLINIAEIITRKVLARNLIKTVIADEIRKRIKDVDALRLKEALCSDAVKTAIDELNEETTDDDAKTKIINALNSVLNNNNAIKSLLKTESVKAEIANAILCARKREETVDKVIQSISANSRIDRIVSSVLKNKTVESLKKTVLGSDLKDAILFSLKTNALNVNEVRTTISASLKNDEGKIKDAISAVFKDVDLTETISAALCEQEVINGVKKKLNDLERMTVKKAINNVLSDKEVNSSIEKALKNDVLAILDKGIQSQINKCVKDAINNENEAQKYRFVERVVSEICKNNKPNACDIAQIRAMIGDVFGTNHMCQCWDISEEDKKVIITIQDINCKKLIITFHKDTNIIDSSSTNGKYTLCNGVVITIKDGNIDDIKKP